MNPKKAPDKKKISSPAARPAGKGLGKGLGALLSSEGIPESKKDSVVNLKINDVSPNADQPRKIFDDEKLRELAESIKSNGIIIPIIVKREGSSYKIVAGERRWRAARIAGLSLVPAIIRDLSDTQVLQQALIENIQRQDLNPIEEANAINRLTKKHRLTQEKLAQVLGKSRPAITNSLRLLSLPKEISDMVENDEMSAGHARTLLSLADKDLQIKAAKSIVEKELSVRDTEKLIKKMLSPKKETKPVDENRQSSIKEFETNLSRYLGTKVKLKDKNKKGSVLIEYYSYDDLDRIYEIITKNNH